MKKLYLIFVFVLCAVGAYYLTNYLMSKGGEPENPTVSADTIPPIITNPVVNTVSVDTVQNNDVKEIQISNEEHKAGASKNYDDKKDDVVVQEHPTKHVNISFDEIKKLIMNGRYEKDNRLSKKYKIEYLDVSDDDAMSGLQQNFTFIQQQIEFENWRGFEVVGLDYDEHGLVNLVKIQPIY